MLFDHPPVKIVEQLWMFGTAAYPLYLVKDGPEAAIFEGGTGAMGRLLREQLAELGLDRNVEVRQIVLTHAHPDHVMAVPSLRRMFPQAAVVASAVAARTLAAEKAVAFFCQIDQALTGSLLRSGAIRDVHQVEPLAEKQISVDRTVAQGETIAVGALAFSVLETPGHSECSLSFYEPKQRMLIISDATGYYMPDADSWWPNYFFDYRAYLDSMKRLAELDADVLCLSHNCVICGEEHIKRYFRRAIAATEKYHERIVAESRSGRPPRELAEELGAEIHAKTQLLPLDFFQKNCALLVKQSLRHEGIGS